MHPRLLRLALLLTVLTLGLHGCKKKSGRRRPFKAQPCALVFPKAPPTLVRLTLKVVSSRPADQQYDYAGGLGRWQGTGVLFVRDGFARSQSVVCSVPPDAVLPSAELTFTETESHAFGPEPAKVSADVDGALTVRDAAGQVVLTLTMVPERVTFLYQKHTRTIYDGAVGSQLSDNAFDPIESATAVALGDTSQLDTLGLDAVRYGVKHDPAVLGKLLDAHQGALSPQAQAARAVNARRFAEAGALGVAAVPALLAILDGPWFYTAPDAELDAAIAALAALTGPEAEAAITRLTTSDGYAQKVVGPRLRQAVAALRGGAAGAGDAGAP